LQVGIRDAFEKVKYDTSGTFLNSLQLLSNLALFGPELAHSATLVHSMNFEDL